MGFSSSDIAIWFAARDDETEPDRTPMKVLKLIYFAQAHHLAATGQPLVDERTWAWDHGPVYAPARHLMKGFGNGPFKPDATCAFDSSTEAFLTAVDAQYGKLSAFALRGISHRDAPYASVYVPHVKSIEIPNELMTEFYRREDQASRWIDHPDFVAVSRVAEDEMDSVDVDSVVQEFRAALSAAG